METSSSGGGGSVVDVFEVFMLKHVQKSDLESLTLENLRGKYTQIIPISSKEQVQNGNCNALAVVPNSNHMVVDKSKFQDMVTKQIKQKLDIELNKLTENQKSTIDNLKNEAFQLFEDERRKLNDVVRKRVNEERSRTRDIITKLLESETDSKVLKRLIEQRLEEEEKVINAVFEDPLRLVAEKNTSNAIVTHIFIVVWILL